MKILVVATQWFPDFTGGQARVVTATATGLASRGHRVTAIVPRDPDLPELEASDGVELHRSLRRSALPTTLTDVYEIGRATRELGADSLDIIIAHGGVAAAGAVLTRPRRPVNYVFHSSAPLEARDRRRRGSGRIEAIRSRLVEPVMAISERLALSKADQILVLSRFSEGLVASRNPNVEKRLGVVGGGVDLDVFAPASERKALRRSLGIANGDLVLLTARRLVNRMGVDVLIAAFDQVRRGHGAAKLVIVGDGELRGPLEALRDRYNLSQEVRFLGRIEDADLVRWYQAADLFVLPTVAYEGFGMATVEALACGTPVVGSAVGATPEILGPLDSSLLVQDVSGPALAAKIEEWLGRLGDGLRQQCATYAACNFGWAEILNRWESAVEGISAPATTGTESDAFV